jgi:hypothetical protein
LQSEGLISTQAQCLGDAGVVEAVMKAIGLSLGIVIIRLKQLNYGCDEAAM